MKSTAVDQHLQSNGNDYDYDYDYDDHDNNHDNDNDDEETLSLRDLPISTVDLHHTMTTTNHTRRSSSSSSDSSFFEFRSAATTTVSTADDVILDGHILPYAPQPQLLPRRSLSLSSAATRSEPTRSEFSSSRSLNYRKLRRTEAKTEVSSSLSYSRSSTSSRCRGNCDVMSVKSPWYYWLVFGLPARVSAEIEMKDIKQRQSRRNFTPSRFSPGDRRSNSSASWRVLDVLSCKSHSSIDVAHAPRVIP